MVKVLPVILKYPFIHLGGEKHCESKVALLRTQHCPGPLDPETSALLMSPPHLFSVAIR